VLDEKGVLLVPGTIFDVPGRRFRLGLGRRSFADGLARLEEYVATT
jgi:aspartate/methionine/tyrosine aminotransferase